MERWNQPADGSPPDEDGQFASLVRPYAWTAGRTRPVKELAIEALVEARTASSQAEEGMRAEHRRIVQLCERPRSVAEVAAMMDVPLGVIRVLLGDMAALGMVLVHQAGTETDNDAGPDLPVLERLLDGLRRL